MNRPHMMPRSTRKTLEHYAAELATARHEMPLAYLRWADQKMVGAIARGGGPLYTGDRFHLYCPVCTCRKSGHVEEPNTHDEGCSDDGCRCHDDETDIEYQVCVEHDDRPAVVELSVAFPGGLNRWIAICEDCRGTWADPEHTRALTW